MKTTLAVNEEFGPTIQGEGRFCGQLAHFVRLSGCNLHCHWCDTPYTWAWNERLAKKHKDGKVFALANERRRVTVEDLLVRLPSTDNLIVITGGEPMLQQGAVREMCHSLIITGYRVCIETAGTIAPNNWEGLEYQVRWTVSPKLENSGNELQRRFNLEALQAFNVAYADFKFVVCAVHDLEEIELIQREVGIPNTRMWLMAEGTSSDRREVERKLIDIVLAHGWNLSSRKHIELWGDERGR